MIFATSAGPRQPGLIQAFILLVTSSLTVLATAILGPSMPQMQVHFANEPNADYLVPLTMTAPMLMMAICSIFAGALSDRLGRKGLLVGSTLFYAAFGTAPLYLDSLHAILASRAALGVMEAALMTVSTAMIGDYWEGARRDRYMALQTTVASASAFMLNNLGGVIGEFGWRAPYAVYVISLVLAPLMVFFLWEPARETPRGEIAVAVGDPPFRPELLAFVCMLAVATGIVFMVVPVNFGYLFGEIGVQSSARIGVAYGVNSLGVIAGTLTFGWVLARRVGVASQLALAYAVTGLAFIGMRYAGDYTSLTAAGFVNGYGAGLLLPAMVTWNMRMLPLAKRGFGIGAFQSCLFLGMFLDPIVVVRLQQAVGARAGAVGVVGTVLLGFALTWVLGAIAGKGDAKQEPALKV